MTRGAALVGLAVAIVGVACSEAPAAPASDRARAALLGGVPSGEDENAAVFIETRGETNTLRCSGRFVAPGLVLTARHCLLARKVQAIRCNTDGSPVDVADDTDLRAEPPDRVTVYLGASKPSFRAIAARQVVVPVGASLCKSDLGFVVLNEAGLDVRIPLRRTAVRRGDVLSVSGWGYTRDDTDALPSERATLRDLRVRDVGPGRLPPGSFSIAGNTMCFGDSGAVAIIDGAAAGVYSRITGEGTRCSLPETENVFTAVGPQSEIVARAYAAIGEAPWYEDAVAAPDAAPPNDPDGGGADAPAPAAPTASTGGCAFASRAAAGGTPAFAVAIFFIASMFRRRLSTSLTRRTLS